MQIYQSDDWKFDSGNGFLYEKAGYEGPINEESKTTFGYSVNPVKLYDQGEPADHSPLIGWAFDGNPIYGPYGYANNKNLSGGVERQQTAYRLRASRNNIVPAQSNVIGTNPPLESDYLLGYFVQDYVYGPYRS